MASANSTTVVATGRKSVRVLPPVEEVDIASAPYSKQFFEGRHLTGLSLKLFVRLLESALGSAIVSALKRKNSFPQILKQTVIPEAPMIRPELPPQEKEAGVVTIREDTDSAGRLDVALSCLPAYDQSRVANIGSASTPFLYWTIRDYAHAYRAQLTTPSIVAEHIITVVEDYSRRDPPMPLLIYFDKDDLRKQAAASTKRFLDGRPLSIMDGIFVAIKDDVDCYPYPSKGGSTWLHKVREVKKDAVCVARLRSGGAVFIGKANMHELGMGTTGNNPNYGTVRNPHSQDRYTGGSSSGSAAIVSCGLCPAALGTDGGGSIRIPSSLCGNVGLKTNYGRTSMQGVVCSGGTVEVVGPITATVEDAMLVYAVIAGASPSDTIGQKPGPICLPNLLATNKMDVLGSLKLGKYTEWFTDVRSPEISDKCEEALHLLTETSGCSISEIVLPELNEMTIAHMVTIFCETLCALNADLVDGRRSSITSDVRLIFALFENTSGAEYVAAQRLRRRMMYYHLEAFKKVDVIVTPTIGMTAPVIHLDSIKSGESDPPTLAYLMRFIIAANFLGFPAITVPIGHDKHGLPIGLQLIGRPWGEANLLRLASAIEELCLPSRKRPSTFYDVLKTA